MKIRFKEIQRFDQWWFRLILIGVLLIPVYGIYKQLILGEPFGNQPMSDAGLVIFAILMLIFVAAMWFMRIKTEIDPGEIRMNFFPFVKKKVRWTDIKRAEVLDYGFVGGWGIRPFTRYGTVYNTKGKTGLAIELRNGQKFLIGTQKGDELSKIIEKALKNESL